MKPIFRSVPVLVGLLAGAAQADGTVPPDGLSVTAAPAPSLTFAFDIEPEFYASSKPGSYALGDLAETQFRIALAKALPNGMSVAGNLSETVRVPNTSGEGSTYNQAEAVVGYKWKPAEGVAIPLSATLGYAFGEEPKIDPANPDAPEAYYALNLGAEWKIDKALTWTVLELRYRNAFEVQWQTPKASTGFSYAFSETGSIFGNFGKSWENTGAGYTNDKYSVAFGAKILF